MPSHYEGMRYDVACDTVNILENEYYSFDIGQLLNVINEIFGDGGRVFFEAEPSLAFPASDISSVDIDINEKFARITMPIMNLLGISSPLPIKFSDYITRSRPDADFYRDFLSVAQNRLHSLWLDARQKYAFWSDAADTVRAVLESMPPRSSSALKLHIKSAWRGIPVNMEENIGRLTSAGNVRALGCGLRLGLNSVAGTKIYDRASKFRVSLGPLAYDTYKTFLPGEHNYQRLKNMITSCLNEPLICELEILCPQSALPPARLGDSREGRLGRTAVLGGARTCGAVHRYRAGLDKRD